MRQNRIKGLTTDNGISAEYDYTAFGQRVVTQQSDANVQSHYTYTGREFEEEDLYYYRARYYDPQIGRFLSNDPIGLEGGLNEYLYVNNNPIMFKDPTGNVLFFGAAVGGLTDLGIQLILNGGDISCVSWGQVAGSAALGAVTGGLGSTAGRKGLTAGLKRLSNKNKGTIGEALSTAKHILIGSRRLGTQQRIPGQRSIADSVWRGRDGSIYYVESKFGTSGLTKAQRAAQKALGGTYQVDRWGYPWFGNVGSTLGNTAGAATGGAVNAASSSCECN